MSAAVRIVSCVRQALDWTLSTKDFRIDAQTHEPVVAFARYRIDQFDEIAVEIALQCKQGADAEVHALSAGPRAAEDVLKHALAMGTSHATLAEHGESGGQSVPGVLAGAIRALGGADLVLCGRTGSERGTATTAPLLAELLDLPLVTNVVRVERDAEGWLCQREEAGGYERVLMDGPLVVSVTNASFNVPRTPSLKDKMRAHRQKIEVLASDAGEDANALAPLEVLRRYVPQIARQGTRLEGDAAQQARALAEYIHGSLQRAH